MVVKEFYETRKDGVNLVISLDALVDENGKVIRDENNKPIPSGFRIQKVGTNEIYDEAIDVETATYEYVKTDKPIEYPPEQVDHEDEPIEPIEPIEGETDEATTEDYIEALAELGVEE